MNTLHVPSNRPALVTAAVGVVCLVAGAIWPWFTSPVGLLGSLPSPWWLWSTVAAGIGVLVVVAFRARPRWAWLLVVVLVIAAFGARASADPGWMCWDGLDDDGNMIGGCEDDTWTPAAIIFAAGVALTVVAAFLAHMAARRARAVSAGPSPDPQA